MYFSPTTKGLKELALSCGSILVLLLLPCFSCAQLPDEQGRQPGQYVQVELNSGTELEGLLLKEESDSISLQVASLGVLRIAVKDIHSIKKIKVQVTAGGEYFYHNLQATRYFFGANGFGLKKGEGYYQNTWILVNQASYGFSDYFTLGVGVVPLFLFAGESTPVWITPKISIPLKRDAVNLGVGGLFGAVLGEEESSFGIGYGALTLGDRDNNVNFGIGYGMAGGEWGSVPSFTISAMARLSRKFYLITENYILPDAEIGIASVGGRSFLKRVSLDYGLVFPLNIDVFIAVPWLGLTIPIVSN